MTAERAVPDANEPRSRHALGIVFLALLVAFGTWFRIHVAVIDPNFDVRDAKGLLRSDPALLYYATERIVDAHGAAPADLRADPRIEWPDASDWPAMETVGQEFVCAWAKLWIWRDAPLHMVCTWVMAFFASLVAAGVYGLAWEMTRKVGWACAAAILWSTLLTSYRTIGFILIREDFSLCWFALHLWLAARALRVRSIPSIVLAGLALGLALSTWHAMAFVTAVEAAVVFAWVLRSGRNPFAARGAWVFALVLALFGACVPVLRSKLFVLSPTMCIVYALLALAWAERRRTARPSRRIAIALGALAIPLVISAIVSRALHGGQADYAHVGEFLLAKVRHLGKRPADPSELSFDARLLWTGPFLSADWSDYCVGLPGAALFAVIAAAVFARGWWRGEGDERAQVLAMLAFLGLVLMLLAVRLFVLPGMIAPVLTVLLLSRVSYGRWILGAVIVGQLTLMQIFYSVFVILWYTPPGRGQEQAQLVDFVRARVPAGEAIASDYVNSSMLLATTFHPSIVQPKYETLRSRERIEELYTALFRGTPEELRALLAKYRCRYLLVDLMTLRSTMSYAGGIRDYPAPVDERTAFGRFWNDDPAKQPPPAGYKLIYRSTNRDLNIYRLYELQ
jgi:hypothetical protein